MSSNQTFDKTMWKKKATAFVIRSHRHLWGKNNEDPHVFLYTQGLKNQFAKEQVLGWNKFGQERPAENWGLSREFTSDSKSEKKLFFPSGIVVPFIVEKELKSVFIQPFNINNQEKTILVPGSRTPTMLLQKESGEKIKKIAVVHHLFDGLFLFQETKETCCVIIHPDPVLPLDPHLIPFIKNAGTLLIFSADKTQDRWNRKAFPDLLDHCFLAYQSKEELIRLCSMNLRQPFSSS